MQIRVQIGFKKRIRGNGRFFGFALVRNKNDLNMSRSQKSEHSHIACYVTNHGFGHINRLVAVLNEIHSDSKITVRSDQEIWPVLRERLNRTIEFGYFPSDNGTASPPGQNSQTDWRGTFERLENRFQLILDAIPNEVNWLKQAGVTAVYADSSPLPLIAAETADIPAFLGANFTWHEIYEDLLNAEPAHNFAKDDQIRYRQIIDQQKAACRSATILKFWPHTPMPGVGKSSIDVGLVVNQGHNVRNDILNQFQLPMETKLIYFYVGRYGVESLPWEKLNQFPENVRFVGLHPPGIELPGRFFCLNANEFSGADLLMSCDLAIVKAGYGAVAEAMVAGTPVIYPPRESFYEFHFLDCALRQWSGGYPVTEDDFTELNLWDVASRALNNPVNPPNVASDGATQVARILSESGTNSLNFNG
ncbi:MAG: hypothetical protein RJA81_1841 [Planctomycetota bacterium]|jgi:hypothetical protein